MSDTAITTCDEAIRVLAEHLDQELDHRLDAQLLAHLDSCRSCCSRAEFERRLKARVRELGTETVPDDVARRMQSLLDGFASTG
jgi:anti-sigma factor (TIGR02949 family)